jgi:hypothetical protein
MDLMFKATDKAAWDAFAATLPACDIDEIGQIGKPPTFDNDGNMPTPGGITEGYHVNVRMTDPKADFAALARGADGVKWIDPATVESPARIWSGGMNYWQPEA